MKKLLFLLVIAVLLFSGCGFFNDTYVVESDYTLPVGKEPVRDGIVYITALSDLLDTIRTTVADGKKTQTILFDSSYSGNPSEDLASACWQVRTEDALCAYCVENIAYELSQIVSYTEANLNISYSSGALPVEEIITMPYATELDDRIAEAIRSGTSRLAILINRSTLTAETMMAKFSEVYRASPGLAPQEPICDVTLFSGSGTQRLYEILLDTGLSKEEFIRRQEAIDHVELHVEPEVSEKERIQVVAEYLRNRCDPNGFGTVYDALVGGAAGPEGISLGFAELSRRIGLECLVVYGQKDWVDHCWNIVRMDGSYFHVDLFAPQEKGFLKSDEDFWGEYRWNVNDYPKCDVSYAADSVDPLLSVDKDYIPEEWSMSEKKEPESLEEHANMMTEVSVSNQEENPNDETEPVNAVADNKGILPANNVTDPSAILPDGELLPDSIMVIHGESGMS